MSRPLFARRIVARLIVARLLAVLLLLAASLTACAPPAGMSATLTMLPGTFTPRPPTRAPTSTPDLSATPTITQESYSYPTDTPTPNGTETPGTGTPSFSATMTSQATPGTSETPGTPSPEGTSTIDATAAACPPFSLDTSLPVPDSPAGYIGKHYDLQALPSGLTLLGSGLLSSTTSSYARVQWRSRDMFWIQKLACQDTSGKPFWQISDALALPLLDAQAHQVYTDVCFNGSTPLPFAIAYGTYNPSQPAAPIVGNFSGWRMQVTAIWQMKEKFTVVSPQSVICMVQQP